MLTPLCSDGRAPAALLCWVGAAESSLDKIQGGSRSQSAPSFPSLFQMGSESPIGHTALPSGSAHQTRKQTQPRTMARHHAERGASSRKAQEKPPA